MGTPNLIGYKNNEKTEGWFLVFSPSVKEAMSGSQECRVNSLLQQNFIGDSPNDLWKILKAENDPQGIEYFTAGPTMTLMALAMGLRNSPDRGDVPNLESLIPEEVITDGYNYVMLKKEGGKWNLHVNKEYIKETISQESFMEEFHKGNIVVGTISDQMFFRLTQVKEGLDVKKTVSTVTMALFTLAAHRNMKENSNWDNILRLLDPSITD